MPIPQPDFLVTPPERINLDYAKAREKGRDDILRNLSGVALAGNFLWTAADEGRSVECLEPDEHGGYRCRKQYSLDDIFPKLPNPPDEADIESLAVTTAKDGTMTLWICGSHCLVRRQSKKEREQEKARKPRRIRSHIDPRQSRHLLGRVTLTKGGGGLDKKSGAALPFANRGGLYQCLVKDDFLEPFMDLPSKENGLDIEGMATEDGRTVFLGLRGPRIDGIAVVLEIKLTKDMRLVGSAPFLHFLDLCGLAVRDLVFIDDAIFILAGPVGPVNGPFRIYRWRPKRRRKTCAPDPVYNWPRIAEHPEALCRLGRDGRKGLIVLYDSPDCKRVSGTSVEADWFAFTPSALHA
jgi:hypothetical protein